MSQKIKLILKCIAIMVVLLALGMQLGFVIIPVVSLYKFWLVVGAFILLLAAG